MKRRLSITAILVAITLAAIVLGLAVGSETLPLFGGNDAQRAIMFEIRMPRVLLGAAVGASLAVAGAGLQALLRNPLAEPYLLGVSNGAALGTMLSFIFAGDASLLRPLFAFAGAAGAAFTVYRMAAGRAGVSVERLILSGVIVTTFLSSVIVLLTSLLDATRFRSFTFWLLGDLSQAGYQGLMFASVAAAVGTLAITAQSRSLNLLMIGERDAADFGVEVGRVRLIVFGAASLLVGATVAASGSVGYVGLIVPHILRLAIGSDNRLVVPLSALAGAAFVVLADTVARTAIAPRELPVGAITALIGAPLFIYLLRRH